ncbi:MAG TPA: hypothetical protein PLJ29_02195, partial [Leptospiraceae bacterium]|nr:hypothetical protein [Leptospiraceae bacterium]
MKKHLIYTNHILKILLLTSLVFCSRGKKDNKGIFLFLLSEQNRLSKIYWDMQSSGVSSDLQSIIFQSGKYYCAGKNGTLLISSDGKSWNRQNLDTDISINKIAYLGGQFFVLGENGLIMISADGQNWKNFSLITKHSLKSIATDGSTFILGGLNPLGKSVVLASRTPETRTSWVESSSVSYSSSIDIAFFLNGKISMWGSTGVYTYCTSDCSTSSGWPGFFRDLTQMNNNVIFDHYVRYNNTVYLASANSGKIYSTANFTDIKEVSGFPAEGRYLFAETDRFSYLGSSLYY